MANYGKLAISVATLGPKIALIGFLAGFIHGGPAGGMVGLIVGGVIGAGFIAAGIGILIYDFYQFSKKLDADLESKSLVSNSNRVINNYTNDNRITVSPVVKNEVSINQSQVKEVSFMDSMYNGFTSLFTFGDKPQEMEVVSVADNTYKM